MLFPLLGVIGRLFPWVRRGVVKSGPEKKWRFPAWSGGRCHLHPAGRGVFMSRAFLQRCTARASLRRIPSLVNGSGNPTSGGITAMAHAITASAPCPASTGDSVFTRTAHAFVDGTLVPTRDYGIVEQPKNYRYSTTRSPSTPTPVSSSHSAAWCSAIATTAGPGRSFRTKAAVGPDHHDMQRNEASWRSVKSMCQEAETSGHGPSGVSHGRPRRSVARSRAAHCGLASWRGYTGSVR